MTAFYTSTLSARPGEEVALHATSAAGSVRIAISRIGQKRETVAEFADIAVGNHPTPPEADSKGCGWPECFRFTVGADWQTGYYDLLMVDADGGEWHHFLCVRPQHGTRGAKALLVLATNTYHAYNYWGGRSAYCDVGALMRGEKPLEEAMKGATGWLSTQRPFAQAFTATPDWAPRLVNLRKRDFMEKPWAVDPDLKVEGEITPYDGSAGFVNKWEHAFVAWAERNGVALDYATDGDLESEPDALDGYAMVMVVGHSEYWGGDERAVIERFVDGGGNLAIFSGNTCFWKIRFDDGGKTFVCHKWSGDSDDAKAQQDPAQLTHLWSHQSLNRPEASITGLCFLFGGYHRLGMCVSRGQGGYTIYDDRHWALDGTDLYYGDIMTGDLPLLGYENDGCRFRFGDDGLPKAIPELGVPENLEIIGLAPCAFGEDPDSPYAPMIPPENLEVIARDVFGGAKSPDDPALIRGHAVMASFRRGDGEVFNSGTTEWAHALAAEDPYVTRITRNVLTRFGAI